MSKKLIAHIILSSKMKLGLFLKWKGCCTVGCYKTIHHSLWQVFLPKIECLLLRNLPSKLKMIREMHLLLHRFFWFQEEMEQESHTYNRRNCQSMFCCCRRARHKSICMWAENYICYAYVLEIFPFTCPSRCCKSSQNASSGSIKPIELVVKWIRGLTSRIVCAPGLFQTDSSWLH